LFLKLETLKVLITDMPTNIQLNTYFQHEFSSQAEFSQLAIQCFIVEFLLEVVNIDECLQAKTETMASRHNIEVFCFVWGFIEPKHLRVSKSIFWSLDNIHAGTCQSTGHTMTVICD